MKRLRARRPPCLPPISGSWLALGKLATRVLVNDRLLRMFAARAIMLFNEFGRP